MQELLMFWTGSNKIWALMGLDPQTLQEQHNLQVDVDLLNGQMINGVMMKTIMQNALGMVVHVVVMTSIPSIVPHVNVLILLMEVPQLLLQPQLLHNLHQQMHVDLHNGQMINGATMKTTMKDVTLMVELVASMTLVVGTHTVKIVSV